MYVHVVPIATALAGRLSKVNLKNMSMVLVLRTLVPNGSLLGLRYHYVSLKLREGRGERERGRE